MATYGPCPSTGRSRRAATIPSSFSSSGMWTSSYQVLYSCSRSGELGQLSTSMIPLAIAVASLWLLVAHRDRIRVGYALARQNVALGHLVVVESVVDPHGGVALLEPGHARAAVARLATE